MNCDTAPAAVGRSKARCTGMTCSAGTRTLSRMTVPLAVVRWPKPDQSSITVSPGASRGMNARCARCSASRPTAGTQWASRAPLE